MQPFADHSRRFGRHPEERAAHAAVESPVVLFLTGYGSTAVPALLTGVRPGAGAFEAL